MDTEQWDPRGYARHAGFVPALATDLVGRLGARPGERVLDLGCGDGTLTALIAEKGADVRGIDASAAMVAAARARGLDAEVMSAEDIRPIGPFDAVFSNAMLHWSTDIDRVLDGVHRILVPGGRFVGEFGGEGNIAAILSSATEVLAHRGMTLRPPWYFPSDTAFRERLGIHGFSVESARLFARPTPLPTGIAGWMETFGGPLLGGLDESERAGVVAELERRLAPNLCRADGTWVADYVRLRFIARRPRQLG